MTPKTQRRLLRGHAPAERNLDAISTKPWVSGGEVQTVYKLVIAHPAFKIDSVLLIQKSIPELLVAEYPVQGDRGGLLSVGGRILCPTRRLFDEIIELPGMKMHCSGNIDERICGCRRGCMRHRRIFLRFNYVGMAASTSRRAHILIARECALGRPPTGINQPHFSCG